MIRTTYDPDADVLHVLFGPESARHDSAQEAAPDVFVEFDAAGNPIGIEVVSVRHRASTAEAQPAVVAA
jgi:uncharacterized protein YuzE